MLAALSALAPAAAAPPASPVVATDLGRVRGQVEQDIASWKGIPFAAPPVGDLRWRMPQPAQPWRDVRDATAYRNDCMQLPFPSDAAPLGTPPSEDCLYVNVWKPARASAAAKLPVLVWIYGGGFVNGGSSPPTYSGALLAKQGIMVVSFNYRIGRFGTFAHPALTAADADRGLLGNYGLMDQIAALRWVRRNIARFGGDPAQVTIMGESAGGMSVHALLTSPMTKGLFARAIILSGGDGAMKGSPAQAEQVGADFAASKGVGSGADALAQLRALTPAQVIDNLNLATLADAARLHYVPPYPDGRIAVSPADAYAADRFAHVPVMIGATSADIGGPDGYMIAGAHRLAATLTERKLPVYAYYFDYVAQSLGRPGAAHASDIPFFFDTQAIKYGAATTPRDNAMGRAMSGYVVNFVRRGDPNGGGLPAWPRYDSQADQVMLFGPQGEAKAARHP
nr:carboxylesterase family protein [Sphingobium amiense]